MDTKTFNNIVDGQVEHIQRVLASKASEYARGDRLSIFKTAARRLGPAFSPERALLGMREKHEVSIMDMVDDLDQGKLPTRELLEEKIGDSINYLVLLKALIIERMGKGEIFHKNGKGEAK